MLIGIILTVVCAVAASIAVPGETGSAVAIAIGLVGLLVTYMAVRANSKEI